MRSSITLSGVRYLLYIFNKRMRRAMQGLLVDMKGVDMVKNHVDNGYKVILMPIYKTYLDFFVMTYVN